MIQAIHVNNPPYDRFQLHLIRCWSGRIGILAVAIVVNLVLFGLMPFLLTHPPERSAEDSIAMPINIIRLQRPEPPVKKNTEKPPEPPARQRKKPEPVKPKTTLAKLTLPFDINTRLPAMTNSLPIPVAPVTDLDKFNDIFSMGELDTPLTVLVRTPPIYPISAKRRGMEGWVRVRFIVNEDGSVDNITVVKSNPQEIFNDAVIRSVSGWRFKAGTIGGVAVKTRVETTIHFNLD